MTYPTNIKVLALDMATSVGWACLANGVLTHGQQSMKRIHGLKRTPDEHAGAAYFKFRNFVTDSIQLHKPQQVVTEYTGFFKSAPARDICCGFRGILMEVLARHDIPLFSYSPGAIKKHWHGKGNADKTQMVAATLKAMPALRSVGEDEADAIAMIHLHLSQKAVSSHS